MTHPAQPGTGAGGQAPASLGDLAATLTQRGYAATIITPAPFLTVRIPGTARPQMIFTSGDGSWWQSAQVTPPCILIPLTAATMAWAIGARWPEAGTGGPGA
jgi:hypothetical protein